VSEVTVCQQANMTFIIERGMRIIKEVQFFCTQEDNISR
jgi:hypothetical protein